MRAFKIVAINLLVFVAFAAFAEAQDTPKPSKGGLLNGKAVSLPKPAYPDEARAAKAEGTVAIKVTVDENGSVIDAEPDAEGSTVRSVDADGTVTNTPHTLPDASLVESARAAAMEAKFSPTLLSGQPVKVIGTIVYNFVASTAKHISGGVLNGKAIELPAPAYPAAAKAVRASGAVAVQVVIDENGEIISATAVSGHPLLRAAATDAAKLAKFSPTKLEGKPVKVSGVLTYNFVLPKENDN